MSFAKKVKTIGVLGGYGPFATNDFFNTVLKKTDAKKDWEHMHLIIDNNPRIPSRARAFLFNEESPVPYMLEGITRLKNAGADFFVCPCNSAHYFLKQEKNLALPFLDMVDATLQRILESKHKKVGILGSEITSMSKLYADVLEQNNIGTDTPSDLNDVRFIIEAGKQNTRLDEAKELMLTLIQKFIDNGADAVIYACTELPIILPIEDCPLPVFDTSSILAEETIKLAKRIEYEQR